jgi:dihydroxyacetone kinase-like protein
MQTLTVDAVFAWINLAADEIERRKAYFNDLDAPIGDSDHGANMARGFSAVKAKLAGQRQADIGALFKVVAMTLLSTVGGASGPLYATFFLQAATKSAGKTELDLAGWTSCLEAALLGVTQRGKAVLGDKTMVDALAPAVAALKRADGKPLGEALTESAKAAEDGMKATIPLVARKGRASYLGERSAGHQDPGATSTHLLLKALTEIVIR